jgi:hypothetical protein
MLTRSNWDIRRYLHVVCRRALEEGLYGAATRDTREDATELCETVPQVRVSDAHRSEGRVEREEVTSTVEHHSMPAVH